MSEPEHKKYRKSCRTCGSTDIRVDAWSAWSEEEQQWVLAETFDDAFCMPCERETRLITKEI